MLIFVWITFVHISLMQNSIKFKSFINAKKIGEMIIFGVSVFGGNSFSTR